MHHPPSPTPLVQEPQLAVWLRARKREKDMKSEENTSMDQDTAAERKSCQACQGGDKK